MIKTDWRIVFTGHRDRLGHQGFLDDLAQSLQAIWVHGGAIGFDSQVAATAERHGVVQEVHLPDYEQHGKRAPLVRNQAMLEWPEPQLVIAAWDGRETGGTAFTVRKAKRLGIPVLYLPTYDVPSATK